MIIGNGDNDQSTAYWSALISGLALIIASMVFRRTPFAAVGALMLLALVFGNPAFILLNDLKSMAAGCGPALNEFVTGLGSKLAGKVSPELVAAVKSINTAHENDKLIDIRISAIESQVSALRLAGGMRENRERTDEMTGIVGG